MTEEQPSAPSGEEGLRVEEPEFFDRKLLLQPPEVRQEYFEQRCLIEHWKRLMPFSKLFVLPEKRSIPGDQAR